MPQIHMSHPLSHEGPLLFGYGEAVNLADTSSPWPLPGYQVSEVVTYLLVEMPSQ